MIRLGSEEDFKGKTNEFEINELLNNINYSNKDKFEIAKMLFSSKDISFDEKKILSGLLRDYKKLFKVCSVSEKKDVSLIEDRFYQKVGINDNENKISFELERIKLNIFNKESLNYEVLEEYQMLIKVVELYFSDKLDKKDDVLKGIFESIVLLELKLGMKIGLYSVIYDLFDKKYEYYMNKKIYAISDVEEVNMRRK